MQDSKQVCVDCNGLGVIYYDKPKVCENCNGKRCCLCDRTGPYTLYYECLKCWGDGVIKNTPSVSKSGNS